MNYLEHYSQIFKALGEPNRLAITLMLEKREMCVCEIVDILPVSFSTISSHLKVLLNAGVVKKERDGKWIVYSLSKESFVRKVLNTLLEELKENEDFKTLLEKVEKVSRESCKLNYREI